MNNEEYTDFVATLVKPGQDIIDEMTTVKHILFIWLWG